MAEPNNQTPINMGTITADYLTAQNELAARYEEQQARLRGELPPEDEALAEILPFAEITPGTRQPSIDPTASKFLAEHGVEIPEPFTSLIPRKPGPAVTVEPRPAPKPPRKLRGPTPPHMHAEPTEPQTLEDEYAIRGEPEPEPKACACGMPGTPGVVHRVDAPCYYQNEPGITGFVGTDRAAAARAERRLAKWRADAAKIADSIATGPTMFTVPPTLPKPFNPWPWLAAAALGVAGMFSALAAFVAYLYLHRS